MSMSSMVDSLAKTSASQITLERAWMESEAAYSSRSLDSLARFDPDSSSWKTSQQSLFGGLIAFSWNSLRSGMTVAGRLFQPPRLEPVTCERDGGFVPTPTARDHKSPGASRTRRASIERRQGIPLSQWFKVTFGMNLFPSFVEGMMGYPEKHTALDAWAMQWFRKQLRQRSKRSLGYKIEKEIK